MRSGTAAGVTEVLPRTVLDDEEVDSVDDDWVVARGLLNAAVKGDKTLEASSLMGDGRRIAEAAGL